MEIKYRDRRRDREDRLAAISVVHLHVTHRGCKVSADSEDSGDPGRSPVLIWRGNTGLWIAARLARLKIVISRVAAVRAKRLAGGISRIKT